MSRRAPTVLAADDSPSVRALVRRLLERRGFQVVEASDGREALDLARANPPDVMLLDIQMPYLDGHQVLRAMSADPDLAVIPVVFLTGRTDVEELVAALHLGGHDFLRKPFEPDELVARVRAAARTAEFATLLRLRNRDLEEFALRATHDLKSPLAIIMGMADTLAEHWDHIDAARRTRLLTRVSDAAQRASTMITDLLELARAGEMAQDDPNSVVNAEEVARSVAADLDMNGELTITGTWATVRMPRAALSSVFANLVDNASHYGRDADGRLEVIMRAWPSEHGLHVVVEDRGMGIDPAEAVKLFEPFYRSARTAGLNTRSTGVGLAIVARTVEQWGGSVVVETAEPQGAMFHLMLPMAESPVVARAPAPPAS